MNTLRTLKRRARETRRAVHHWWWRVTGERARTIEERDAYKAMAAQRFDQYVAARDALYELKIEHRPFAVETMRRVADQIDCGPHCENVSPMDWSTGVQECHLSDKGECPFDDACALRELAFALETHDAVTHLKDTPNVS